MALVLVVVLGVGGTALARAGRESSSERVGTSTPTTLEPTPDVRVFMAPAATPDEIQAVRAKLLADPDVVTLTYQDQVGAYQNFACLFSDQRELVHSVRATELPPSFGADVGGDPSRAQAVGDSVAGFPGVKEVSYRPGLLSASPPSRLTVTIQEHGQTVVTDVPLRRPCPSTATTLKG